MLRLRANQLDVLDQDFYIRRKIRILAELREHHNHFCRHIDDKSALELIGEAIEDGEPLGITEDEDVARFAVLSFLPKSFVGQPLIASVLIRILNNVKSKSSTRLDFIFCNIVNRVNPLLENSLLRNSR